MRLIVDAHQDLAWNAQTFGRDYARSALVTRAAERQAGSLAPVHNGNSLLGLSEYLLGHIAVIFSALFVSPRRASMGEWDALVYNDANEAHRRYAQQLDYYERLADEHPHFALVNSRVDLEAVLATWEPAGDPADPDAPARALARRRVGLVRLMEGADAIREPKEAEWWMERGVRIVGLAWTGTRYAGGTGEPGPLTPEGRRLLGVLSDLGMMLDLAHASDQSFLEALDRFEGTVLVSHANPRALARNARRPERFLSDEMIRRLAERQGVVGVLPANRFLQPEWRPADGKGAVRLDRVVAVIDHICQVTGSAEHAGLGTDFDGGFGVEGVPAEIDTVADLQHVGDALAVRGYAEADVARILSGNWLRLLRQGLPA